MMARYILQDYQSGNLMFDSAEYAGFAGDGLEFAQHIVDTELPGETALVDITMGEVGAAGAFVVYEVEQAAGIPMGFDGTDGDMIARVQDRCARVACLRLQSQDDAEQ